MKKIIFLAALSLLAGCAKESSSSGQRPRKVGILALPNSTVDGITMWKIDKDKTRKPDTDSWYVTKLGERVHWESWGPIKDELDAPNKFKNARKASRFARFPRVYRCSLNNYNPAGSGQEAVFDLYDLGLQRNIDPLTIILASGAPARIYYRDANGNEPTQATKEFNAADDSWDVRPGIYNDNKYVKGRPDLGDFVDAGVTLRFTADQVQFLVYVSGHGMPGESGGSPPPPDPGDDSSDLP